MEDLTLFEYFCGIVLGAGALWHIIRRINNGE